MSSVPTTPKAEEDLILGTDNGAKDIPDHPLKTAHALPAVSSSPNSDHDVVSGSPSDEAGLLAGQLEIVSSCYAQTGPEPGLTFQTDADNDGVVRLAKTFSGLTFQTIVGFVVILASNTQQQVDSSSLLTAVWVTTLLGFAFTISGIMLHKNCPDMAKLFHYVGVFCSALSFFFMMDIFASKDFEWLVWVAGIIPLVIFIYTLCRDMGISRSSAN